MTVLFDKEIVFEKYFELLAKYSLPPYKNMQYLISDIYELGYKKGLADQEGSTKSCKDLE